METYDDDLSRFEIEGVTPLPSPSLEGYFEGDGARIWYASYGVGPAVILLHGGLGHAGNWGFQVPKLLENGYQVVVVDTRGHGRSTRDSRPFTYDQMAVDLVGVMDALSIGRAALVGWSDGACTAMVLAATKPERVSGVFFFACNMDPSGGKEIVFGPALGRCFQAHKQDYALLSQTPEGFERLLADLGVMQKSQPNYSAQRLGEIAVPVVIVQAENDEFITQEHAEYLASSIPAASLVNLEGVSHFAPWQRAGVFSEAILDFLAKVAPGSS